MTPPSERVRCSQSTLRCCLWLAALAAGTVQAPAAEPAPKYGPRATRLFTANDYFRRAAAPDFWALMPYYAPQADDLSCSVASVAMAVNALRAPQDLSADDELASHDALLARVGDKTWTAAVGAGGNGVSLDELERVIRLALAAYDLDDWRVERMHVTQADPQTIASFREILAANERSARDLLLVQFQQSTLTGDPEGAVGHIAPIAAYDAEHDRALILDPDRRWYEPYWVSVSVLVEGMATVDPASRQSRGYVRIRPK